MNIYATDFDGTLNNRPIDAVLLSAIEAWRQAGHLFGVVSGRPYTSIRAVLAQYDIPFDFLIANNGAVIVDSMEQPLLITAFSPADALRLTQMLDREPRSYYRLDNRFGYKDYPRIPPYSLTTDGSGLCVDGVEWRDVTEITSNFGSREEALRETEAIRTALEGRVNPLFYSPCGVDFVAGPVNKSYGIKELVRVLGVTPARIITTGDSFNDLAMLTDPDFEGYAVENALPDVREAVGHTIPAPIDILRQL